jgi:hypothetical protein
MTEKAKIIEAIQTLDIIELASSLDHQNSFMDLQKYTFLGEINKVFEKVIEHDCESLKSIKVKAKDIKQEESPSSLFLKLMNDKSDLEPHTKEIIDDLLANAKDFDPTSIDKNIKNNRLLGYWKYNTNKLETHAFYSLEKEIYFLLSFELDAASHSLINIWLAPEIEPINLFQTFTEITFPKLVKDQYLNYKAMAFQKDVEKTIKTCFDSIFKSKTTIITSENYKQILERFRSITEVTGFLEQLDFHEISSLFNTYDTIFKKLLALDLLFETQDLVSKLTTAMEENKEKISSNLHMILLGDNLIYKLNSLFKEVFIIKPFSKDTNYLIHENPRIELDSAITIPVENFYSKFTSIKEIFLSKK